MEFKFIFVLLAVCFLPSICLASTIEINDFRDNAEYWASRTPNGDNVLLSPRQIAKLNADILEKDKYAVDLAKYPDIVSAADVNVAIKEAENDQLKVAHLVSDDMAIRYAVTIRRGNIRVLPQAWSGDRFDDLQSTAIDPAEAVVVLCDSPDGNFFFIQSRNYIGWIDKSDIAFTDRKTWLSYVNPKDFLVVTANKKTIEIDGQSLLFQMGAIIPIINSNAHINSWIMRLPTSVNGQLKEFNVKISTHDEDVNKGFIACTENNFIKQAFKFRGDEYGWGGLYDSVDCSAFVQDIYRSMGINIPRDTKRQAGCMPIWAVFNDVTNAERWDIVKRAPVGSLLLKPGHVMMKLGSDDDGRPLVIHAASSYFDNGKKVYISKVIVSDLHYKNAADVETIDALTDIAFYGGQND